MAAGALAVFLLVSPPVAAGTCLDAGMLATFAIIQGADAESFLKEEQVQHWLLR